MNKIRSLASYAHKLLCLFSRGKFCKKTLYSGIALICDFPKQCFIITKTCNCFSYFPVVSARTDNKRLDWKHKSRGLISHRRLVDSRFQMASYVSIMVEICDEKMANIWRKTATIYSLLSFILFFLSGSGSNSGFDVCFFSLSAVSRR